MKPVVANPSASFEQLLDGLEVLEDEKQIECQIDQIIAKLQRKKRKLDSKTLEHFVSMTGGMDPTQSVSYTHLDVYKRQTGYLHGKKDDIFYRSRWTTH